MGRSGRDMVDVHTLLNSLRSLLDGCTVTLFSWKFWGIKPLGKFHFFTDEEVVGLDQELVAKLDWARGRAGVPFTITSGLRSPSQNKTVKGVQDSAHLRGLGVDLRVENGSARFKMVQALLLAGFRRIGIYDKHIHADRDETLPQDVIWVGESH